MKNCLNILCQHFVKSCSLLSSYYLHFFPLDPSSKALVESQKMETQPTILHSLQQQYDASRYMTHVARGAGLGYGTDLQSREPFEQQSDKL